MACVSTSEEGVCQCPLGVMQTYDFLFDGVFADQMIDGDGLMLSDSVGAVGGLLLYGRIPPRVEVDDVVGGCEVESESACLQTDKEKGATAVLKGINHIGALLQGNAAIDVVVGYAHAVELAAHDIEETDKFSTAGEVQKMCLAAAENGTGLCISTAGVKTLRFLPPLVITKEEVDTGLAVLKSILS